MSEEFSPEEIARRKRLVFESMSERRRRHILKRGYEAWDPFAEPKDPIDIRRDPTRRTAHALVREFLASRGKPFPNAAYGRGVLEMALGMVNAEDRARGMFEFACWYRELLGREGPKSGDPAA